VAELQSLTHQKPAKSTRHKPSELTSFKNEFSFLFLLI
jgi:hypothetical protein